MGDSPSGSPPDAHAHSPVADFYRRGAEDDEDDEDDEDMITTEAKVAMSNCKHSLAADKMLEAMVEAEKEIDNESENAWKVSVFSLALPAQSIGRCNRTHHFRALPLVLRHRPARILRAYTQRHVKDNEIKLLPEELPVILVPEGISLDDILEDESKPSSPNRSKPSSPKEVDQLQEVRNELALYHEDLPTLHTLAELLDLHCIEEPIPEIRKAMSDLERAIGSALRTAEKQALSYELFLDAANLKGHGTRPTVTTLDVGCIRLDGSDLWPDEESELVDASPIYAPLLVNAQLAVFNDAAKEKPREVILKSAIELEMETFAKEQAEARKREEEKHAQGNAVIDVVMGFLKEKKGGVRDQDSKQARDAKKDRDAHRRASSI
eukprot:7207009-Prymnesium_polylepis.1